MTFSKNNTDLNESLDSEKESLEPNVELLAKNLRASLEALKSKFNEINSTS
jgi:hypothetical protein